MTEWVLALLVVWPLLWGALTLVMPARMVAVAGGLAALGTAGLGLWAVTLSPQFMVLGNWSIPLGLGWRLDGVAQSLIGVTAVVGGLVSVYAWLDKSLPPTFWGLWLGAWGAMNALFLTADVFHFYVTLELLSVASVSMVALTPGAGATRAAFRYLLVSLTGSMLFLLGVALLYGRYGVLDMTLLAEKMTPDWLSMLAFALMTVGLLAKTAVFPLHGWLPQAHAKALTAVSAILSALVIKAAFYGLMRLWLEVFAPLATVSASWVLGLLASAAIFWGGYQALKTSRLKRLVAWSTVAQVGVLVLALALVVQAKATSSVPSVHLWQGLVWLIAVHALAKAGWFLAAGTVQKRAESDYLAQIGFALHRSPISVVAMALAVISLAGLPFTMGFLGKWWLLSLAWELQAWAWLLVSLLGSLLTLAYGWRLLNLSLINRGLPQALHPVSVARDWVALFMALLGVLGGFGGHWFWEGV
jgi:formate hydrogenlyase subunit 3/multisubunit Na+/H+ antiporter MnhD subunit